MSACQDCEHCQNGWFEGTEIECVNGVLIDIDVAHEGWQRDVVYPLAPCHPEYSKPEDEQVNDSQARLASWADLAGGSDAITAGNLEADHARLTARVAKLEAALRTVQFALRHDSGSAAIVTAALTPEPR